LNRLKKLNMVCRDGCRGVLPAAAIDGAVARGRACAAVDRQCGKALERRYFTRRAADAPRG
jgi:hypothetical protein